MTSPTQEDSETWELYGPKVFHLDMTGPELVMHIRLAAEEHGARMALEAAAKAGYAACAQKRHVSLGDAVATAIHQIDPAALGAE